MLAVTGTAGANVDVPGSLAVTLHVPAMWGVSTPPDVTVQTLGVLEV
jgi:hypothetical protein